MNDTINDTEGVIAFVAHIAGNLEADDIARPRDELIAALRESVTVDGYHTDDINIELIEAVSRNV